MANGWCKFASATGMSVWVLCVKFSNGGHGLAGLSSLAEVGFLVLPEVVHVEVAMGFEPVFVGLDG
jgi:hypothetical protein